MTHCIPLKRMLFVVLSIPSHVGFLSEQNKSFFICTFLADGQETIVSWWPPPTFWKENVKTSFWNEKKNTWFCKRLLELESGNGQPLKPKEFQASIRSCGNFKPV